MVGNQTWFARQDYVEEAWRILDPVLNHPPAVQPYEPGSWGPETANQLAADHGGWRDPL
jgi:glucose-6-phosphate 1-dehydrogenase